MKYLPIEQVKTMDGLRIAACVGAPSPWSLAARALFDHKQTAYTLGAQIIADDNAELKQWTGQNSAPVVAFRASAEQEKIATTAEAIVLLAERIQPEPALIPADQQQRAWMFGLLQALAGEDGFGWNRRLMSLSLAGGSNKLTGNIRTMAFKYDYSDDAAKRAAKRCAHILQLFSGTLHAQEKQGRPFIVGDQLTALDLYFTIFFGIMYQPLPDDRFPIPAMMRSGYEVKNATIEQAADAILFTHRDRILDQHLTPVMDY